MDKVGVWLRDNAGIDLTNHEDIKDWIQNTVDKIGADVDTAGNCYIVYGERHLCNDQLNDMYPSWLSQTKMTLRLRTEIVEP